MALLLAAISSLSLPPSQARAAPWSRTLNPGEEAELLAQLERELPPEQRERLEQAIAKGTLVAAGDCVSSGTFERVEGRSSGWLDEVSSVATIRVSNMSDQLVWAVQLSVTGAHAADDPSVWRANVPFLPPHSQAEFVIGCAQVMAPDGSTANATNELRTAGEASALDGRLAASLAQQPARYRPSEPGQVLAWGEMDHSLARAALPHVPEVEHARRLLRALQRNPGDTPLDSARLIEWLGLPELGGPAALAMVERVLEDPTVDPQAALDKLLASARIELAPALQPLASTRCSALAPQQRAEMIGNQLDALPTTPSALEGAWLAALLEACALQTPQLGTLVDGLAERRRASAPGRPPIAPALATLLSHAPLALLPDLLARVPPPAQELALVYARLEGKEQTARIEVLEAHLLEGADTLRVEALTQLSYYAASQERLARFQRLTSRTLAGESLLPLFEHARTRMLDPKWYEQLLALAKLDPVRLRPLAFEGLASGQQVFRAQALATSELDPQRIAELFASEPCFASPPAPLDGPTLDSCIALFEGEPSLDALARTPQALQPKLLAATQAALALGERVELIDAALAWGVPPEQVAPPLCARVESLQAQGQDASELLERLQQLAAKQPCVQALGQRAKRAALARLVIGGAAALVLLLLALAWRRWRAPVEKARAR